MGNCLVYYNSRKKCFSIKRAGEKIIHSNDFWMADCKCVIWQGVRKKAIKNKVKNVHAFIRGTVIGDLRYPLLMRKEQLRYSPFNGINGFYYDENVLCDHYLNYCHFLNGKVYGYFN